MRIGNTQDLLNATREQASAQIDLKTSTFTPREREQMFAIVGHSMAEISWKSNTSPQDEKRYAIRTLARQSAELIGGAAATLTKGDGATLSRGELTLSPAMRAMVTETRANVLNLWSQHARGR